jgi:arginine exporter protein ArgO
VVALLTAWHAVAHARSSLWVGVMGLIAVLFNPLVPVHFPRETWFFIDLTVAAMLTLYAVTLPRRGP